MATLAKLTRPKLYSVVPRKRLYALLDRARARPVVWVSGPPGAGKTAAVASYLEANKVRGIWYQIDAGDRDPSTLFYYLSLAAEPFGGKRKPPLPLLTPEHLADVPAYTRNYFRLFYNRLKTPAVIVLDNYHELPANSAFHGLLAQALHELPEGLNVIVVSRTDPPAQLVDLEASDRLFRVDYESLRLTLEEAREIAALRHDVDDATLRALHGQSGGWAAGLTLTLERIKRLGEPLQHIQGEALESVFDYFAAEILKSASGEMKEFLLKTALLPRMTGAMAQQLTGNQNAAALLDYLYRRRLFTDRRGSDYQYHDLFRAFLLDQFRQYYAEIGQNELRQRAGKTLENAGQIEAAVGLYVAAQEWQDASRLICQHAPHMQTQGRGQTLRDWIASLPEPVTAAMPWLTYWFATSLIPIDQLAARRRLESVFETFARGGDEIGQSLAAAGIIETYYFEWSNFVPLNKWIEVLEQMLAHRPAFPSGESELRVYSSMLFAVVYRQPRHPLLRASLDRVLGLLTAELDSNQRVTAGTVLLLYFTVAGDFERARRIVSVIHPLLGDPGVTSFSQFFWWARLAYYYNTLGAYKDAIQALDDAEKIASINGLQAGRILLYLHRVLAAIGLEDMESATQYIGKIDADLDPARGMDVVLATEAKSLVALQQGETALSLQYGQACLKAADDVGVPYFEAFLSVPVAHALLETGNQEAAHHCLNRAYALCSGTYVGRYESEFKLVEAYSALRSGRRDRCHDLLREVLGIMRTRYFYIVRFVPHLLARLFEEALGAGIEVVHVRDAITRYAISPASPDVEDWPWPVKVFALGEFEVFQHGVVLGGGGGRSSYRLMGFLKALAGLGGAGVSATALSEALWPDADADTAQQSFYTALHRLRKLLGNEDVILLEDGKVTLNPGHCWTDVAAFERLVVKIEEALRFVPGQDLSALEDTTELVVRIYRGRLLEREPEQAWMLASRDRLHRRFLRVVLTLGREWEERSRWDRAGELYERALEHDNLAEELYRRLIVSHRERGQRAEALSVYRRCRELFSVVLGVEPSADMAAVYRSLKQN